MAGTKLHLVSCFALFALLVAPFAWRQTQVERAELPVDRIRALATNDSRFSRHELRVFVVDGPSNAPLPPATSHGRVEIVSHRLSLSQEQKQQIGRLQHEPQSLDDTLLQVLPTREQTAAFAVVLLCLDEAGDDVRVTVGKHRHAWSSACSPSEPRVARVLQELVDSHVFPAESEDVRSKTRRARVAVKYRLQFSLLQEGGDSQWTWDFDKLYAKYLSPMLKKLESVAQFTIDHQTLYYTRLAKEVHTDAKRNVHYVNAEDLKHFKSTNDFLTSSVLADREQVLHFMAALPTPDHTPLVIKGGASEGGREATAFEIPSWGVLAILDPRELTGSSQSEAKELQRVMGRFVSELRTLLGLPSFVKRQRLANDKRSGLTFLPSPRDGIAQWELDVIVRSLLQRHMRSSIETLQSIVQLVTDMSELSVLDRVAQRISHAVDLVERVLCVDETTMTTSTTDACASSSDAQLLEIARQAVEQADAAYYDHTMIRQLYFPQEQMLGVFAPLLAPLLLPFFVGWLRELKQLRAKRKAQLSKK